MMTISSYKFEASSHKFIELFSPKETSDVCLAISTGILQFFIGKTTKKDVKEELTKHSGLMQWYLGTFGRLPNETFKINEELKINMITLTMEKRLPWAFSQAGTRFFEMNDSSMGAMPVRLLIDAFVHIMNHGIIAISTVASSTAAIRLELQIQEIFDQTILLMEKAATTFPSIYIEECYRIEKINIELTAKWSPAETVIIEPQNVDPSNNC